jgi:two-component system, NarL family, response regulator DesR
MVKRVLIADDSEVLRDVIRTFLEQRLDVEVCAETSDGKETVTWAEAVQPDIIVLDMLMPSLNGLEVAARLKKSLPTAKIVLFTMYGEYAETLAASAGADIVVGKQDGLAPLIRAIESLVTDTGSADKPQLGKAAKAT